MVIQFPKKSDKMISDLLRVTIFVNCYTPLVPATFNHAKQDREKKRETDRESEGERESEIERDIEITIVQCEIYNT